MYLKTNEWVDGVWQWDELCLARTCPPWGKPPWLPVNHQPFLCPSRSAHSSQRWHTCFRYNHAQWTKQTVTATTSFYMYVQELMQYVYKALPVYMSKDYSKLSWRWITFLEILCTSSVVTSLPVGKEKKKENKTDKSLCLLYLLEG